MVHVTPLIACKDGVTLEGLDPDFLDLLADFADAVVEHRYAKAIGLTELVVTSALRENSGGSHGMGCGVDIRGHWLPDDETERLKYTIWFCTLWAVMAEADLCSWGIGVYLDDMHFHFDNRAHTDGAIDDAVWVKS